MDARISNRTEVLTWLEHHWLLILVLIALYFFISVAIEIYEAYDDIQKRPKEKMEWCAKHGPIRKKHCLPLFPGMKKSNGEEFVACPICYKENVFDNPDARLT